MLQQQCPFKCGTEAGSIHGDARLAQEPAERLSMPPVERCRERLQRLAYCPQ
jgi:hypothetical protein